MPRPWTVEEEERLRNHLRHNYRYPFAIAIDYVAEIPRSAAGKYEDFRSLIGGDRTS